MLALGIDPGTATTGYGVVRRDDRHQLHLVECGVIRTAPRDSLACRLNEIFEGVTDVIARLHPEAVAVEGVFYARNARTSITLGHARGVIILAAARAGLPVHEFPPAEIKKAVVGAGSATKEQVQYMVARLLRLREAPAPSDAADGVAAALTLLLRAHLLALQDTPPVSGRLPISRFA